MRRIAAILVGVLLGAIGAELGLRAVFPPAMADRLYWGPDAFVPAEAPLYYRHLPDAELTMAREGIFGPLTVRTNAHGFRGPAPGPTRRGPRVVVLGASFVFGIGIEDEDALFDAHLRRGLERRLDWPARVEVYNLSQGGYVVASMDALIAAEQARFDPDLVLWMLPDRAWEPLTEVDVVNGVRLVAGRPGADGILDTARTRIFSVMRFARPWQGGAAGHAQRLRDWSGLDAPGAAAAPDDGWIEHIDAQVDRLAEAAARLESDGIAVIFVPVGRRALGVSGHLEGRGLRAIPVGADESWELHPADGHWNRRGHERAARQVLLQIPAAERLGIDRE